MIYIETIRRRRRFSFALLLALAAVIAAIPRLASADPYTGATRSVLTGISGTSHGGPAIVRLSFKSEPAVYQTPKTNGMPFVVRLYRTAVVDVPPVVRVGYVTMSTVASGNIVDVAFSASKPLTARIIRSRNALQLEVVEAAPATALSRLAVRPTSGMMRHDNLHSLTPRYFESEARRRFLQEQRARPHGGLGYDRVITHTSERPAAFTKVDGTTVNAVAVSIITIGTTETDTKAKTRSYTYTFNTTTGGLLQYVVRVATADEARSANLSVSQSGEAK